ncbi:hypothetical protein Droror1_Dr00020230, partial [Drosera rotundifolia]
MLFVQGINTLLQTLFGTRLPAAIGGSYAYMVPIVSIINDPSLVGIESPSLVLQSSGNGPSDCFGGLWPVRSRFPH